MRTRVSALFVLASQALLLLLVYDTSGMTAIAFSFLGHPMMVLGVAFGIWALYASRGGAAAVDDAQNEKTTLTP